MERFVSFESIRNTTTIIIMGAVLSGCFENEGDTSFSGIDFADLELSGSVGDGPVTGANVRVVSKDGKILAEFLSDASANYNIMLEMRSKYYPLTVKATGGTDLVTNRPPDFALTGAVFESGNSSVVNINPFSTVAVALARELSGGLTAANLDSAERTVATALNSGLDGLKSTGPMSTRIDESNIAEIVKASETLGEMVRRTRDVLRAAGFSENGDGVVRALASDLTDGVIDGAGGNDTDRRTSAVSTIVYAQVLLESMANELWVNGSDATGAMGSAIAQVSSASPTRTIDELDVTAEMIERTLVGLAAAYELDENPAIVQLHTAVSGIQAGQDSISVRGLLPAGYRDVLQNALSAIAGEDSQTLDLVNAVARTGGEIDAPNLAPSIQGVPASTVVAGSSYSFTPSAADVDGDVLMFEIVNSPSWANFDTTTGQLSGTPTATDVGTHANILISVSDGEFTTSLAPFTIDVSADNSAPQISGMAPGSINVGGNYSFVPTASDPDGDTLTFSVSALPSWANFDTTTGQLSGTPTATDVGTHANISISVSDGEFTTSLAPFSIDVSADNSAPQISGMAPGSINVGGNYSFVPTASDPDGDTLMFNVSALPSWASFNTTTGQLSGTPTATDVGTHANISISVSDGEFSASLAPFMIDVNANNSAPQISGVAPVSVNVGGNYSFLPTASDPDGDMLMFSVSALPSWASFDTSTGRISGTPQSGDIGTYSNISIMVSDGQANASLAPFSISVQAVSLGSVTLSWTPPTQNEDGTALTDLDGYRIYWGTTAGNYPNSVTIDNESVSTYVIDNLSPGTYEFVATSFNTSGVESAYSSPATKVVQ